MVGSMLSSNLPPGGFFRHMRAALPDWSEHALVVRLFTRLLGLIFLAAFVSLGVQIEGLVGQAGILPLTDYLEHARTTLGESAYWRLPTLFWLDASDSILRLACGADYLLYRLIDAIADTRIASESRIAAGPITGCARAAKTFSAIAEFPRPVGPSPIPA